MMENLQDGRKSAIVMKGTKIGNGELMRQNGQKSEANGLKTKNFQYGHKMHFPLSGLLFVCEFGDDFESFVRMMKRRRSTRCKIEGNLRKIWQR